MKKLAGTMIILAGLIYFLPRVAQSDLIFSDDFSGGHPGAWSIGHDGGGGSYSWAWPDNYAYCYANPSGGMYYYPDNLNVYMERHNVNLSAYDSATLSFYYIVDSQASYDYFTVNVRDQSGGWHELFRDSGVTDPLDWTYMELDLSVFAGQSGLYVQFRFDSNGSVSGSPYDGAYVDIVELTATSSCMADMYEPDNISAWANEQPVNTSYGAHGICPGSDIDWIYFNLTEKSEVTIETVGSSSDDTVMTLYYSDLLVQIDQDDDGGDGTLSKIERLGPDALGPGKYYVKIEEYGNDDIIGGYGIELGAVPRADLRPYQPSGWDDKIVVSNVTGTRTDSTIYANAPAYIDVAWENFGSANAGAHRTDLLLNSSPFKYTNVAGLQAGYYIHGDDWQHTFTSIGWQTLTLDVDVNEQVQEFDEADNQYSRQVYVNPGFRLTAADAFPCDINGNELTDIDPNDSIYICISWSCLHLAGSGFTTPQFRIEAWLDGSLFYYNDTETAQSGNIYISKAGSWSATPGDHNVTWKLDVNNNVFEYDETDNNVSENPCFHVNDYLNPEIRIEPLTLDFTYPSAAASSSLGSPDNVSIVNADDSDDNRLAVAYAFDYPQFFSDGNYDAVVKGKMDIYTEDTRPRVPFFSARILIPPGKTYKEVMVAPPFYQGIDREVSLDYNRFQTISQSSGAGPVPASWISPEPFPERDFEVLGIQRFRGYNVLIVKLYPFKYVGETHRLLYADKINVTVLLEDSPAATNDKGPKIRPLLQDKNLLSRKIDNNWTLQQLPSVSFESPSLTYSYVTITDETLQDAFQALADHKSAKGLSVLVVTAQSIYSNAAYDGQDDQEEIRNFITYAYNNWQTQYVLLGGDVEIIPYRGMYGRVNAIEDDNIPADIYYSNLDGSFNHDGDARWGESNDGEDGGEIDLQAEVFVGRITVNTVTEANRAINKIIAYETSSPGENVLLIGQKLNDSPETWGGDHKDETRNLMPVDWTFTTLYNRDGTFSRTAVINQLNGNQHFVNHAGHSDRDGVMALSRTDVASLTNTNYFLAYSWGCYSASFDNRDSLGSYGSDAVGEAFIYSEHAAFAYIGNSRFGWYSPGSTNGTSQIYDEAFTDALFNEDITNIGAALVDSKEEQIGIVGSTGSERWIYFALNLLGDPETHFSGEGTVGSFTVYNDGLGPLDVSNITSRDGSAWIDASPTNFTVPPGGSQGVTVSVSPDSLSPGSYSDKIQVYSNDADANPYPDGVYINLSVIDAVAPSPDPMTWSTSPYPVSSTSIGMTASLATDEHSPPVSYFFDFNSGGPGGNDSGWQSGRSYTDNGLAQNTNYCYRVKARDNASQPNETSYSSVECIYTLADPPLAPIVGNPTETTLSVDLQPDSNPIYTRYAIYNETGGYYLDASGGNNGAVKVWRTQAEWGVVVATGLSPDTAYSFRAIAINEDGIEAGPGPSGQGSTLPSNPDQDSDGLLDAVENSYCTDPANPDSDGDGLCDGLNTVAPVCVAGEDMNADGLVDGSETDPCKADTDGDSLDDGLETGCMDPLNWDSDGDYLPDGFELANLSNPLGNLDPCQTLDGAMSFDGDGMPNNHEYWNRSDLWADDPQPTPGYEVGCYYWGKSDGGIAVQPGDIVAMQKAYVGVSVDYSEVLPSQYDPMDLDRDMFPGPGDIVLAQGMYAGLSRSGGYVSSPIALTVEDAPAGPVAVGDTTHVTVSVHAAGPAAEEYSPGMGVVFWVMSGNAVLLGGEGSDPGEAVGNRYDVSMKGADGAPANVVVLVTGPGPVIVNAKIPACGTEPVGRWCGEIILSAPVEINP